MVVAPEWWGLACGSPGRYYSSCPGRRICKKSLLWWWGHGDTHGRGYISMGINVVYLQFMGGVSIVKNVNGNYRPTFITGWRPPWSMTLMRGAACQVRNSSAWCVFVPHPPCHSPPLRPGGIWLVGPWQPTFWTTPKMSRTIQNRLDVRFSKSQRIIPASWNREMPCVQPLQRELLRELRDGIINRSQPVWPPGRLALWSGATVHWVLESAGHFHFSWSIRVGIPRVPREMGSSDAVPILVVQTGVAFSWCAWRLLRPGLESTREHKGAMVGHRLESGWWPFGIIYIIYHDIWWYMMIYDDICRCIIITVATWFIRALLGPSESPNGNDPCPADPVVWWLSGKFFLFALGMIFMHHSSIGIFNQHWHHSSTGKLWCILLYLI